MKTANLVNNKTMAYDKNKIFEQAKEQITKNNLFFVEDIVAFLPCSKTYFYDTFVIDSDEMNALKDLLEVNKIKTKSSIRAKLYKGNKAAELISLYKLIATDTERRALSMHQEPTATVNYNVNVDKNEIKGILDDFNSEL